MRVKVPLVWWVPIGRAIETDDGTLAIGMYGASSNDRLKATIHNCGLLRSTDGGDTWSDFSSISRGAGHVQGAADINRFAFESPQLQVLPDGRWLAVITGRRLNRSGNGPTAINEEPGAPQVLCRLCSTDEGRTWTQANQISPSAWPGLSVAGQDTLCANTHWCAWGTMRLLVSPNGLRLVQTDNSPDHTRVDLWHDQPAAENAAAAHGALSREQWRPSI